LCYSDCMTQGNVQIQCNSYQVTYGISHRTRKKFFKFVWKHKRPRIAKTILTKTNKAGGIRFPDFRIYFKQTKQKQYSTGTKQNRDQRNRTESPETNPHTYSQFIMTKKARMYNGGKTVSSVSGAGKMTSYM